MPVIGLTGGLATGKTLVTDYLRTKGVVVIDADQLAREVVRMGEPAYHEIVAAFGPDVLSTDGTLDRKRLASLIFDSAEQRARLESIVHPRVYGLAWNRIREIQSRTPNALIVFAVPLLFETYRQAQMDRVVVVYADETRQIRRLMERNGLTEESARKRISAQISTERKKQEADHVIDNSGSLEETLQQVDALLSEWLKL